MPHCALTALPPEIGRLVSLTHLDCHDNQLAALPPEMGQLANLERLDLHENNLRALPVELANLINLRWLNLQDNAFQPVDFQTVDFQTSAALGIPSEILDTPRNPAAIIRYFTKD